MMSVSFVQETRVTEYHITGNFCGAKFLRFFTKKKTFNFCRFFFCGLKILAPKIFFFVLQEATTEAMLRYTTGAHYTGP